MNEDRIGDDRGSSLRKTISILTPCFNEEDNVEELYERVRAAMAGVARYDYEHVFIDNCSSDGTVEILKRIAAQDRNVKVIVNARNFGHIRSPHHALLQTSGDAVIGLVADLQDPPEMIPEFIEKWEQGSFMVLAIKSASDENPLMFWVRKKYYQLVNKLSAIETFQNFTGFGLYDRRVIEEIRRMGDPYPYFRGMIAEIGLPYSTIPFHQPARQHGITKNDFYSLYDMAMLGITNLSKVPLRLMTFSGFVAAAICFLVALFYLLYKLVFWNEFSLGVAPLVIGIFFLGSVQLISVGILGEYVGSIHTRVYNRPLVVERERVNFDCRPGPPRTQSYSPPGDSRPS